MAMKGKTIDLLDTFFSGSSFIVFFIGCVFKIIFSFFGIIGFIQRSFTLVNGTTEKIFVFGIDSRLLKFKMRVKKWCGDVWLCNRDYIFFFIG